MKKLTILFLSLGFSVAVIGADPQLGENNPDDIDCRRVFESNRTVTSTKAVGAPSSDDGSDSASDATNTQGK